MSGEGSGRAAAFFRGRGLDRLIAELRQAYWRNGRPAGMVVLADATDAEHAGLAALDGRTADRGPLRVRLADLDRRLQLSGFGCSLADLLVAYDGTPLRSRRDEREAAADRARQLRERWRATFLAVAEDLPRDAAGRQWLEAGPHGVDWLTRRYGTEPVARLAERQEMIRLIATALTLLPLEPPRRLAVFANELTGNPHALDASEELGRLFLAGLLDLQGEAVELAGTPTERLATAERRRLYAQVGILAETISPTVVAYNLGGAIRLDGTADPLVANHSPTLRVLPLRQILGWRAVRAASPDVYIVENPVVFEDVLDRLDPATAAGQNVPTVICTAGWPSEAGWRLLALLHHDDAPVSFHYSGDFDLAGLRIAAAVQQRFLGQFQPWRMAAADYRQADRAAGVAAPIEDLSQLVSLEPLFPDLVAAMRETGRWAYQEAIAGVLVEDLLCLVSPSVREAG